MCRLYGMVATHPTKAECELLDAQNSLINQAEEDARGLENPDGWGIGYVRGGEADCRRQVEPAKCSETFRREAVQSDAELLIAHVRRATVGTPSLSNTHPFRRVNSFLAHNGHVENFDEIRPRLTEHLREGQRQRIGGSTDSEHIFELLRAEVSAGSTRPEALRRSAALLREWTRESDSKAELALNLLWSDEDQLVGTKLGRSLWYLQRDEPLECEICGHRHAHPDNDEAYRSVVIASEPLTDEPWREVPEASAFAVTESMELKIEGLFA